MNNMTEQLIMEQPSLLGMIVSEVEKLNDTEKRKLLIQLRKDEILNRARNLDAVKGTVNSGAMTDEETDLFISQQRKLRYE
jgi:hypothetical protein